MTFYLFITVYKFCKHIKFQVKMSPRMRVSSETRSRINPAEMDAQLSRLRGQRGGPQPNLRPVEAVQPAADPLRGFRVPFTIQTMNITQANFVCKFFLIKV